MEIICFSPAASSPDEEPADSIPGRGSNAPRRPQYTSIQRNRPSTDAPLEDPDYPDNQRSPGGNRLNYVTIRRSTTPAPQEVETGLDYESGTNTGLQYVTLSRANRVTTPTPENEHNDGKDNEQNLISVDASSFRVRPQRRETTTTEPTTATTTTTTTTTPKPARVVVPVNPERTRIVLNPGLSLDPRKKEKVATVHEQTTTDPAYIDALIDEYVYDYLYDYYEELPLNETESKQQQLEVDTTPAQSTTSTLPPSTSTTAKARTEEPFEEIPLPIEEEVPATTVAVTETPVAKTTVNLLADFPAFASPAPSKSDPIEEEQTDESRY